MNQPIAPARGWAIVAIAATNIAVLRHHIRRVANHPGGEVAEHG